MSNLEQVLNDAIVSSGFRISPRLDLGDRLSRFIQLHYSSKGRNLTDAEADACSSLILLTYNSDSVQRSRRRVTTNQHTVAELMVSLSTIPSSTYKTHSMTLRSTS